MDPTVKSKADTHTAQNVLQNRTVDLLNRGILSACIGRGKYTRA